MAAFTTLPPASDRLRKRVAQPVEHPVAREEKWNRRRAEAEQPLPVADRPLEEQNLLIRDRQVRERIGVEQRLELLDVRLEIRIDDRRCKKPQRQQVGENVADVAKVDRQRGESKPQGGGEY